MLTGLAVLMALLVGFSAGLLTFRVKTHWCPPCGTTLTCAACHRHGAVAP